MRGLPRRRTPPHMIHSANRPSKVVPSLILAALSAVTAHAKVDFEKQVFPFIQKRCIECHDAPKEVDGKMKKPKAELRMDNPVEFMKGSENGPIVKPGDSSKSSLYEVVTLPKDDDMHMPPKGDPLTAAEIALLKTWIDEGADFGNWGKAAGAKPADAFTAAKAVDKVREHNIFYAKLSEGVKPLTEAQIKEALKGGAQVFQLKADSGLVRADFLTGVSACTDAKLEVLLPIKENIAQLDLGRTAITDAGLKTIAKLPRLAQLDLRQTKITDAGLESLTGLKNLQSLNLYGTEITDAGLKQLAAIKSLKTVYLWGSKATEAGAKQLTASIKGVRVVLK
jgi:Planctomycete cytochrome C/Leucine rich repeat